MIISTQAICNSWTCTFIHLIISKGSSYISIWIGCLLSYATCCSHFKFSQINEVPSIKIYEFELAGETICFNRTRGWTDVKLNIPFESCTCWIDYVWFTCAEKISSAWVCTKFPIFKINGNSERNPISSDGCLLF